MTYSNDGRYDKGTLLGRKHVDEKGREFIRLSVQGADWQIGEVGNQLRKLTALPKDTKDGSGEVQVPLTWAMVTQMSKLMEEQGYGWRPDPGLSEWILAEFTRRHDEGNGLKFDLSSLDWTPMPHQVAGAYIASLNRRFFIGDAPRLGKTRTALLTLAELDAQGLDPFPAMVVAPASVVDPWLEELNAAFPSWPAAAYRGPKRRNLSTRYKVYVMSWDTMRTDMHVKEHAVCGSGTITELTRGVEKAFMRHKMAPNVYPVPLCECCMQAMEVVPTSNKLPPLVDFLVPRSIILDEAHGLCNVKTRQSVAARRLARVAEFAYPMSGTPITKDVGGFWSALNVLDTRSFPDQERYKARYTDRFSTDYAEEVTGLNENRAEFYTLMQGSMRYLAQADVVEDLPPKTYSTRVVQLPPAHRAAYDEMELDMIAHIPDTDEPLEVMSTLAQLQRLTQLASSACDVEKVEELDERPDSPTFGELIPKFHVTMREPSWKIDELMALMDDYQGSPLITFSPHTQFIKLAGARAEKHGYKVGYIIGGQTAAQRTAVRKAFQAGDLDLLCCNVTAGGVGLTLNRGDTIVFLERPFAYWQANQAEARADDIRNAKQVHIIDIVAADTVESRVRAVLQDKARQLSELVRDPRIVKEFLGGQDIHIK